MSNLEEDVYFTIKSKSEGFYKEKGSKFLGFAYPVANESDIKHTLELVRKEFYDARHHCYAYIWGYKQESYRANDDGEPSNSAGKPILGQIQAKNLTNVLIVVVRYFGGTKLGVGGLMQAYKTASLEALNNAEIIEKQIKDEFVIKFEYPQMNNVMKIIKKHSLEIFSQEMTLDCQMKIAVRQSISKQVQEELEDIEHLHLALNI